MKRIEQIIARDLDYYSWSESEWDRGRPAPWLERKVTDREIETVCIAPPIPSKGFDWQATRAGYDEGDQIGRGATEQEAVSDLLEQEGA